MKRGISTILFGALGFAGGLAAGLLIAPRSGKENRRWIKDHSEDTRHWLEHQGRKIKEDGEKKIDRVSKNIRETVKNSVPDLYEATEELYFTEEEEVEEITRHG